MQIAIYPGSFDPITYGHIDVIERGARLFDKLIVVIMKNEDKHGTFSMEERMDMIKNSISYLDNVEVCIGEGLTARFAEKVGATALLRGIRAISDYEYEMQMAIANMTIFEDLETVLLVAKPQYSFMSSSIARTIAANHGDVRVFVNDYVREKLEEKFK